MSFIVYSIDGCKHCELVKDLMLLAKQEHVKHGLCEEHPSELQYSSSKYSTTVGTTI